MQINLHLGIHKTATTYQQDQLKLSKSFILENHGVEYIPLTIMRQGITKAIRNDDSVTIKNILSPYTNSEKLIISDENITGSAQEVITGKIYQNTSGIIEKIRSSFPNARIEVFISIRNPCDFLASIYCEYLRHNRFIKFEQFIKKTGPDFFDWVNLFTNTFKAHSDIQFHILDFDNYEKNKDEHIKLLSFSTINKFDPMVEASRKTLTKECINILSNFPHMSNRILNTMESENYIYGNKFSPFCEIERESYIKEYKIQLKSLKKIKNMAVI